MDHMLDRIKKILFPILVFFLISTENSYAYIDPGTGSIILQTILGAIAAGFSYCMFYWNKVRNFFKKKDTKQEKIK